MDEPKFTTDPNEIVIPVTYTTVPVGLRFFSLEDEELQPEDIDLNTGWLQRSSKFKQHHEEVLEQPEQYHFIVDKVYFEDGSEYIPVENDSHIRTIDAQQGLFEYINLDDEEEKIVRGINLYKVIDAPSTPGQPAWDEYEDVLIFIPYTEEQLALKQERDAKQQEQDQFLDQGPEKLDNTMSSVEDLILVMADIIGSE